ncbi:adenylate cyclase [Schistosoma japonicum]|nr:adenylate cyclase [Schistosoma japonicum]
MYRKLCNLTIMVMKCSVNWYTRTRYLTLLAILLVPLYISLELCFFISDQYVFYRCAVDEGLTYEIMDGKFTLIANNQSDKRALEDGQRRAAWIGACNHSVRLLLGLLTTMIIGYISDHYGRRLSLIIMVIGEALQILTLSVVVLMQANPWLTVIPGLFDGAIGGGLLSIQAQVSASLTDIVSNEMFGKDVTNNKVSDENDLWALFTWFDGLALICLSLSYPLGGTILYRNGFLTPIIVCNVLIAMSLLLIFFLPESNTRIWSSSICKYNDEYIEIFLARNANSAIWKINCSAICMMFINRMILGISYLFTPFAANILVYIAAIPRFAKGLNNPILRTLISLWTDKINQGMMHSFVAFISRLGVLICFSALIFIYSSTINLLPGTVFFVCCSLILTAMIATGYVNEFLCFGDHETQYCL